MLMKQCAKWYEGAARAAVAMGLATAAMIASSVELTRGEDQIAVTIGGKPFTTYYFHKDVAKAYLMPLRTPSRSTARAPGRNVRNFSKPSPLKSRRSATRSSNAPAPRPDSCPGA